MSKDDYKDGVKEEKPRASSRLGKEAKIGVTVIALLAIILGVVVVLRLRGSTADDKPAVAVDREGDKERAGHAGKAELTFREARSKSFGGGATATIVPAKAVSAKPPRPAADSDPWKVASDRSDARRSGADASPGMPSPLMPEPPKPRAERRQRYTVDPPPAAGYALVEAAPAPPMRREPSRYEHPATPPVSLRSEPSYSTGLDRSTPAMPVSQYESSDYRRESAEPRRFGGGSRHAASLHNDRVARRDDGKYEVQPNDSYWTISERLYGTGAYFKALAEQNRGNGSADERLRPGELIVAPTVAELEKSFPDLCPKPSRREALQSQSQSRASTVSSRNQYRGRTYTVVEGDTLFNIARYELGKASRWAEIYELNRDVLGKDFNYLTPGIQLALPEGEKSDVIAQPAGNLYRR